MTELLFFCFMLSEGATLAVPKGIVNPKVLCL